MLNITNTSEEHLDPEEGGSKFLQNNGISQSNTTLYPGNYIYDGTAKTSSLIDLVRISD
jgi:hypothetical protein